MSINVPEISSDKVVIGNFINKINLRSGIPESLRLTLERFCFGGATPEDYAVLERALIAGGGEGNLAFGDASLIVAEANSVNNETIIYDGPSADAVALALQNIQKKVDANQAKKAQQALAAAVRKHSVELPYLMPFTDSSRILNKTFIDLKAKPADAPDDANSTNATELIGKTFADGASILALTGPAGAGKSTLLRKLAGLSLDGSPELGFESSHLVLPIRLRHLASAHGSTPGLRLWRAIEKSNELVLPDAAPPENYFSDWGKESGSSWLLLLDAMDEVPPEQCKDLCNWIARLVEELPELRCIVTMRHIDLLAGTSIASIPELVLQPLKSSQARRLLENWLSEEDASNLYAQSRQRNVNNLLQLPLTSALAAVIYARDKCLPASRTEMLERVVSICFDEAERRGLTANLKSIDSCLSTSVLLPLVQRLALNFAEEPRKIQSQRYLLRRIAAHLMDIRPELSFEHAQALAAPLHELIGRLAGLTEPGVGLNWVHADIKDILAANALVSRSRGDPGEITNAMRRWRDWQWRGVIVATAGIIGQEGEGELLEEGIDAILDDKSDGAEKRDGSTMAAHILAEAGAISEACEERIFTALASESEDLRYKNICARLLSASSDIWFWEVLDRFRVNDRLLTSFASCVESDLDELLNSKSRRDRHDAILTLCYLRQWSKLETLSFSEDDFELEVLEATARAESGLDPRWCKKIGARCLEKALAQPAEHDCRTTDQHLRHNERIALAAKLGRRNGCWDFWFDEFLRQKDRRDIALAIAIGLCDRETSQERFDENDSISLNLRICALEEILQRTNCCDDHRSNLIGRIEALYEGNFEAVFEDPVLLLIVARILKDKGQHEDAMILIQSGIALAPDSSAARQTRASIWAAIEWFCAAMNDYGDAIALSDPSTDEQELGLLHLDRASAARQGEKFDEACADADRAIGLISGSKVLALAERGLSLGKLGFYAAAWDDLCYEYLIDVQKSELSTWVHEIAALCGLCVGDRQGAERSLAFAYASCEQNGEAKSILYHLLAVEVCLLAEEVDQCRDHLRSAREIGGSEEWVDAHQRLVDAVGSKKIVTLDASDITENNILSLWLASAADNEKAGRYSLSRIWEEGNEITVRTYYYEAQRLHRYLGHKWLGDLVRDMEDDRRLNLDPPAFESLTGRQLAMEQWERRKKPDRLPMDMLCHRESILGFDFEKHEAQAVLAGAKDERTMVIFGLEDGDHVYIHANFVGPSAPKDALPMKAVLPYQLGTQQDVLPRLLIDAGPQSILFTDEVIFKKFKYADKYWQLADRMKLIESEGRLATLH